MSLNFGSIRVECCIGLAHCGREDEHLNFRIAILLCGIATLALDAQIPAPTVLQRPPFNPKVPPSGAPRTSLMMRRPKKNPGLANSSGVRRLRTKAERKADAKQVKAFLAKHPQF